MPGRELESHHPPSSFSAAAPTWHLWQQRKGGRGCRLVGGAQGGTGRAGAAVPAGRGVHAACAAGRRPRQPRRGQPPRDGVRPPGAGRAGSGHCPAHKLAGWGRCAPSLAGPRSGLPACCDAAPGLDPCVRPDRCRDVKTLYPKRCMPCIGSTAWAHGALTDEAAPPGTAVPRVPSFQSLARNPARCTQD